MAALVYSCPGCGGAVDAGALRCPYCESPIATVRCGRCFHMNLFEAMYCSGCGRELGLEPVGEPASLDCPRCTTAFQAFRGDEGHLYDCAGCGGQFAEHALLRDLLERREAYGAAAPRPTVRHQPDLAVRYVACPVCRAIMNRNNFAGSSGVVVDVCRSHGVWFDIGELPKVIAFVESGGLARSARTEAATVALEPPKGVRYTATDREKRTPIQEPSSVDDVADAARFLLDAALDALLSHGSHRG